MTNNRQLRVAQTIKQEISKILREIYHAELESISLTVSYVKIAADLRNVTIYIAPLFQSITEETLMPILEELKPEIRYLLTQSITLKYSPEICFKFDKGFDNVDAVYNLK